MKVKSLRSALLELAEESVVKAARIEARCGRCQRCEDAEARRLRLMAEQAQEVAAALWF